MKTDFIDIKDFSAQELEKIIDLALKLKKIPISESRNFLSNQNLVMIFEKNSTRTRVSFDIAMKQLGGQTIIMDSSSTQISNGENMHDTAKVLSQYADIIMMRCKSHETLIEIAKYAQIPVINGLTDYSHPCQIIASILTIIEKFGDLHGKIISWFGEPNNVLNSYIHAVKKFGFELRISKPNSMTFSDNEINNEKSQGAKIEIFDNPKDAAKNADVIITDTWFSMGDSYKDHQVKKDQKIRLLKPYQVNTSIMKLANKNAIFTHCLPVYRGFEATAEVVDSKQSVIFEEAENRLHAQKAIIYYLMSSDVI